MADAGLISFTEPFKQLRNQGVLHAAGGQRMSKSRGNVVTPDEVIAEHGTDALRAYILFIGPFEGDVIWEGGNIKGVGRFLERYWKLAQEFAAGELGSVGDEAHREDERDFQRHTHQLIKTVTEDLERYKFNTAVAALMAHLNYLYSQREAPLSKRAWQDGLEAFTRLVSPITPFIAEEVWAECLGHQGKSVHKLSWLAYDEEVVRADEMEIMIQINGRLRDKVVVPRGISDEELQEAALSQANVQRHIGDQPIDRIVIVPRRLINFVTAENQG
jgi:leucyl-tRNA synthetase